MIQKFLDICHSIGVPISMDKTEWATVRIIFLGILLDSHSMTLAVPLEKCLRAISMLQVMVHKKKATVKELQTLCGFLNFLNKAIFPGCTFTRQMYAKFSKILDLHILGHSGLSQDYSREYKLKQHHHVTLDREFKLDCQVWLQFLDQDDQVMKIVNRKMVDIRDPLNSMSTIFFTSDASAAPNLGYGCIMNDHWMFGKWESDFVCKYKPSIEYLELFALTAGVLAWSSRYLQNCKLMVLCNNQAVVQMINNLTSSCKNCMFLLQLLVLDGLRHNRQLVARYINMKANYLSDALSRQRIDKFKKLAPTSMRKQPDTITNLLWPLSKLWIEV